MDTLTLFLASVFGIGVISFFLWKKWLITSRTSHQKRIAVISDCISQHQQQIKIRQSYLDNYNFTDYNLAEVLAVQNAVVCS